jgi:hypothetical protein
LKSINDQIGKISEIYDLIKNKEEEKLTPILAQIKESISEVAKKESYSDQNVLSVLKSIAGKIDAVKDEIEPFDFNFDELAQILSGLNKEILTRIDNINFDKYQKPSEALAVKIIDKDGKIINDFASRWGGGYPNIGVFDAAGARINPATTEKQDAIIAAINAMDVSALATEATLSSFATAFNTAVNNYISFLDDISVYSAFISDNTAGILVDTGNIQATTDELRLTIEKENVSRQWSRLMMVGALVDNNTSYGTMTPSDLNVAKNGILRVILSSQNTDAVIFKEGSGTLGGANVLGVAAARDSANRGKALLVDGSNYLQTVISAALPAGSAAIGKLAANSGVDIGDVTVNNTSGAQAIPVVPEVNATGVGKDTLFDADADNTAQQLKASAGRLYKLQVSNINTTDAFIQLFDAATGSVTVGTTTPKLSFLVPKGNGVDYGSLDIDFGDIGITFATAITYAATTTPTGAGDPTTGLTFNAIYK